MQKPQMYLSQSLRRAQQFLVAHSEAVGLTSNSEARQQLDRAIVAMGAAVVEQDTIARELKGEVSRRRQLESTLVTKYMTPLAKYARASMTGVPDFSALTPSARAMQRDRLVTAARSMAAAAEKYSAQLVQGKFPASFLPQLRAATDALATSIDAAADKRTVRTGATNRIESAGVEGRRAIAAIDAALSHLIHGDERLEREWRSAKRLRRSSVLSAGAVAGSIAPVVVTTPAPVAVAPTPEVTKAAA